MRYDYNTIDAIYDAVFGCEVEIHGTVNPSIIPASGTIEIISDDMEVAQIECDLDGTVVSFDYYCA